MLRLRAPAILFGLALAALASTAGRADAVAVSVGTGNGLAGQTVDVDINTASLTGLNVKSLQFDLTYNPNVVTATGVVTTGSLTAAASWSTPAFNVDLVNSGTGRIRVSDAGTTALTGAGSLLKVRFLINPTLLNGSSTGLNIANVVFNEGTPTVTTTNGSLTVGVTPQIDVAPDAGEIIRGQTLAMSVSGAVTNPVSWSTSSNAIATISAAGVLTGVAPGAVTVTALDAGAHSNTTTGQILVRGMGLTAGVLSIPQGLTGQVPITVTSLNGLGIRSGQFTLTWFVGQNYVTATGVSTPVGTLLNGWGPVGFSSAPGTCTVDFAGSTDLSGTGVLCYVNFQASSTATGSSGLTVVNPLFNETMPAKPTNGNIAVTALPPIFVTPDVVTLLAGQTQAMTVSGTPTPPITWSTLNPAVATINAAGLLTAVHSGVTQVKAVDNLGSTDLNSSVLVYDFKATLGTGTGKPGTTVHIPLQMDRTIGTLNARSLQCKITWTGTSIAGVVPVNSALWSEWGANGWSYATTPNSITVAHAGTSPLDNLSTDLAAFDFQIAPAAVSGTDVPLTLTSLILNEGDPSAQIVSGVLRIRNTVDAAPERAVFSLGSAAPNPVRASTRLSFSLPSAPSGGMPAVLAVYSLDGRRVRTLVDAVLGAGPHEALWDGRDENGAPARSGLYFVRLDAGGRSRTGKLSVMR